MRISDWSSDVCSSDLAVGRQGPRRRLDARRHRAAAGRRQPLLTRSARTRTVFVGWVERSGFQQRSWSTLRPPAISRTMGFAALYPSYGVRLWLGGVEAVVVEDRVEDQRVAAARFAAPDRGDREQQPVAEIGRAPRRERVVQ